MKAGDRRPCATVLHKETRAAPPEERPGGGGEGPPRDYDCIAQVIGEKPELGGNNARPGEQWGGAREGGPAAETVGGRPLKATMSHGSPGRPPTGRDPGGAGKSGFNV